MAGIEYVAVNDSAERKAWRNAVANAHGGTEQLKELRNARRRAKEPFAAIDRQNELKTQSVGEGTDRGNSFGQGRWLIG